MRLPKLVEFKARQLGRLYNLERRLLERYPDRAERVKYIVDLIANKTYSLKTHSLPDYLHTLLLARREFPEFEELIPSAREVEELLEGGE